MEKIEGIQMSNPIIVVNFKTYSESSADNAVSLAHNIQEVSKDTGVTMAIAPQAVDLKSIREAVDIPVYAQHIDPITPGGHTGSYLPEALIQAGINGTLINHSERRLTLADIDAVVENTKKYNLTSILCANNIKTSTACAYFEPDYIAIEPPKLIGSGVAVSTANPEIVQNTVESIHKVNDKIPVLCGAGISSGDDVKAALDLGAEGVLLASGVIKADDQKQVLYDLVSKI